MLPLRLKSLISWDYIPSEEEIGIYRALVLLAVMDFMKASTGCQELSLVRSNVIYLYNKLCLLVML
jgi:hypothetical protein